MDRAAEANVNAIVADIADTADADQVWEVIVFPKSPWADPTLATLRVGVNTYVDESRTIVQTGPGLTCEACTWVPMNIRPMSSAWNNRYPSA